MKRVGIVGQENKGRVCAQCLPINPPASTSGKGNSFYELHSSVGGKSNQFKLAMGNLVKKQ